MNNATQEWNEISNPMTCKSFISAEEDTVIHIIKTGYGDAEIGYLVVYEDAYLEKLGTTEILSRKEVEKKFNVKLSYFKD